MSDAVTMTQAAKLAGCDRTTISRECQPGRPLSFGVIEPGSGRKSAQLLLAVVECWAAIRREQRPLDPQHERARRDAASASMGEFRLRVAEGDFLPRDEVERQCMAENTAVKNRLLSWSQTLVDHLHRASTVEGLAGVERVLDRAVRDVLLELSSPERPIA